MVRKIKTAVLIFTIKQLRKLLELLYTDERPKDKETKELIQHLQEELHKHTGTWIVS